MKTITALDRSILALLAAARYAPPTEYEPLVARLSPDAREIAVAILKMKGLRPALAEEEPSESAKKTARALMAMA